MIVKCSKNYVDVTWALQVTPHPRRLQLLPILLQIIICCLIITIIIQERQCTQECLQTITKEAFTGGTLTPTFPPCPPQMPGKGPWQQQSAWRPEACTRSCYNLLGLFPQMKPICELWNNDEPRPTVEEHPKVALNVTPFLTSSNHFLVKRRKKVMKKMRLISAPFACVVSF